MRGVKKNTCKIVREVLTFYRDFVSEAEEIDGRQKAAPGKQIGAIVPLADVIRGGFRFEPNPSPNAIIFSREIMD